MIIIYMVKQVLFSFLILAGSLNACVRDESFGPVDPGNNTIRDSSFSMTILEPSDLAFSSTKKTFFTVSDNTGLIYEISRKGVTLNAFDFMGGDLEGICVDNINGHIYIADERTNQIVHLSSAGLEIEKFSLPNYQSNDANSGFEGISKNGDTLYIVKEKNPSLLIKYHLITKNWVSIPLSFALDFSAVSFDATDNTLWILSDESKAIFHCNLKGKPFTKQTIKVDQPEGITIDHDSNCAWIVGDSDKKLFKISLKQINI